MITGANENDYHIKGVDINRDVNVKSYYNIRQIKNGDRCIKCGEKLQINSALELGHIFKLGTKYSASMGAHFLDPEGKERPIVMGSYGIGLERIMACAVEQRNDEKGIIWPISIAPFDIYLLILNPQDEGIKKISNDVIGFLNDANFSMIIDDRDLSAGIKFNDADLIGIPLRVTIGPKGLKNNKFDISIRESGERIECSKEQIKEVCIKLKEKLMAGFNV
jgi:prolyl-tRNA synthetase